jgi:hypothetical protein
MSNDHNSKLTMHTVWIHLLWVLEMTKKFAAKLCFTCTRVKQLYGSADTVAPWLCACKQKSAQSSLPVAKPDAQQRITLSGTPLQQLANWRNLKP